jgi:hypothetical protein
MKTRIAPVASLAALALTIGAGLGALTTTSAPAVAHVASATDDPPPDPVECPFCGGNPELHRARVVALERFVAGAAQLVTP